MKEIRKKAGSRTRWLQFKVNKFCPIKKTELSRKIMRKKSTFTHIVTGFLRTRTEQSSPRKLSTGGSTFNLTYADFLPSLAAVLYSDVIFDQSENVKVMSFVFHLG